MNCDRARILIDPHSTGELDLATTVEVEEHLGNCAACSAEFASLRNLRSALSDPSLRYAAPADLHRDLKLRMNHHEVAPAHPTRRWGWMSYGVAAAVAMLLILPWVTMYLGNWRDKSNQFADEVTASHIRSLQGEHLMDVPSTDQHTVKPWFNGKLDFSPNVVDLTKSGFPLIGGRLDYLDHRPVAAIVYQRHKHIVNLYTWPATSADASPSLRHDNGYNVLKWTSDGMSYCAVSDVSPADLQTFAALLGNKPAATRSGS